MVQQSKEHGGMRVTNPKLHSSLLKKWLWRYAEDRPALWKNLIQQKYGQNGQWCTDESTDTHGVGLWRTIRSFRSNMAEDITFQVGNGKNILF